MLSKRDVALNCTVLLLCALAVIGIDLGTTYSVRLHTVTLSNSPYADVSILVAVRRVS